MKKRNLFIIGGMLFIAAVLLLLTFMEISEPQSIPGQNVSLRADTKDLSIDEMINTVENRKRPSDTEVAPGFIGNHSSGTSSDQSPVREDDPEAVARVQELIRANEDNMESGLQQIDRERQGNYESAETISPEYVPVRLRTAKTAERKLEEPEPEKAPGETAKPDSVREEVNAEPKKRSPFNSIRLTDSTGKNAVKAYVHSEQVVMAGSTLKMRLGENAYTDNGTLIPQNSPIFGTVTSIDGERVNVRITNINVQGNILPFEKQVYSKDALLGIYVPGNPKAETTKDVTGGALDGLPISGIPGVDAATQIAGVVATSAANAGKQALSKNVKKVKVTIKTNYEIYLRPEEKR